MRATSQGHGRHPNRRVSVAGLRRTQAAKLTDGVQHELRHVAADESSSAPERVPDANQTRRWTQLSSSPNACTAGDANACSIHSCCTFACVHTIRPCSVGACAYCHAAARTVKPAAAQAAHKGCAARRSEEPTSPATRITCATRGQCAHRWQQRGGWAIKGSESSPQIFGGKVRSAHS